MNFMLARSIRTLAAVLVIFACASATSAQCALELLPGGALAGIRGDIEVMRLWDPDGPGPAGSLVVAGGLFDAVGAVDSPNVAAFDPQTGTWRAVGAGVNGRVRAVLPMPNGDLIVAGDLTDTHGVPLNRIARWNGTTWSPLGPGFDATVWSLALTPDGRVIAAGSFRALGDATPMFSIAAWNGTAWSQLGSGLGSGAYSVAVATNGDVIAGGVFNQAGGVAASRIARWNGTNWAPIGSGFTTHVFCVLAQPNGDIIASCEGVLFSQQSPSVQQWDGTTWSSLGLEPDYPVWALERAANGDLIVGGDFTTILNGTPAAHVARWNGATWFAMAAGVPRLVRGLCAMPGGDIAVGSVRSSNTDPAATRWNGAAWSLLGVGTDRQIFAVARLQGGDVVVGGAFTTIAGIAANGIARWDGAAWHPLGSGVDGQVRTLHVLPDGDVVAGGSFAHAGGVPATNIARWNGTSWSGLGIGLGVANQPDQQVGAIASMPNGDIVAMGTFSIATNGDGSSLPVTNIARWDGAGWHPLTSGIVLSSWLLNPMLLKVLPSGDLIAGGYIVTAGGVNVSGTAIWNGTTWRAGPAVVIATAIDVLDNGDLVLASLSPSSSGSIQLLHNGSSISLGQADAAVTAFGRTPSGDLVAAGDFTSIAGLPANGLARWNGAAWLPIGSGVPGGGVQGLCTTGAGEIALGGSFTTVFGQSSVFFARIRSTCPASAPPTGAGCSGSYGPVTLAADTSPWIGHPYRLTASGFGPNSLAVWIAGTTQSALPLSSIHPAGLPGCMLWSSFEVEFDFNFPVGGVVTHTVFVPNTPALVGLAFQQQVANVELDASLDIAAIATSNGIGPTVGVF